MKTLQKGISIALLALAGMASAFAGPGRGGDQRDADRSAHQMPRQLERNEPQYERRPQQQPGPDAQGRHGRMSPEERRALRQQINEANQDIRPPRR